MGEPASRVGGSDAMVQYGDNPYFVSGGAGMGAGAGIAPSARSMSPPSHYPSSSTEQALYLPAGAGAPTSPTSPHSPPGTDSSGSQYGPAPSMHAAAVGAAMLRVPSPTSTSSSSAKEREARYGRSGTAMLGLATQPEEDAGHGQGHVAQSSVGSTGTGTVGGGRGDEVVVHSDGGRVEQEEEQGPTEIPPAYDSIPADDRGR